MNYNKAYDIIIEECGANPECKEAFLAYFEDKSISVPKEFRFMGRLGFGGKIWNNRGKIYVTCYKEDETLERRMAIAKANQRLIVEVQNESGKVL